MKTFVGILLMTKLKLEDSSEEELVAILQRRGKFDTENNYGFKMQSFPGLCEITSYGKANENETPEAALKREMIEELGEKATDIILKSNPVKIYENTEKDGDKVFVWTTMCNKEILKDIKLEISTEGIEIVRKADLDKISFAGIEQKGMEVNNLEKITIFEVPVKVLRKAFEIFE